MKNQTIKTVRKIVIYGFLNSVFIFNAIAQEQNPDYGSNTLTSFNAPTRLGKAITTVSYQSIIYILCGASSNVNMFGVDSANNLEPLNPALLSQGVGNGPGYATIQNNFLYFANSNSNNISIYKINPATGQPLPLSGSPFSYSVVSPALAFDPSGQYAYLLSSASDSLNLFKLQPGGTFSINSTASYPSGKIANIGLGPGFLYFNAPTNTAYVPNAQGNNITLFDYNPATGEVVPREAKVDSRGAVPRAIKIINGKYMYVVNGASNTVAEFTIDGGGNLSYQSKKNVAIDPVAIRSDDNQKFLFILGSQSDTITILKINPDSGELTNIDGGTIKTSIAQPSSMYVVGQQLFVISKSSNSVDIFDINQDSGQLSFSRNFPVTSGCYMPSGLVVLSLK